ncbi:MAG: pyruvate kinase [Clostridia bacterium]|nr:pyruvate kinase [Clostridia bacterium]
MKKTKIICTMGPNTNDRELIKQLALAGMDIARFNFSHGDHEEQAGRVALVKSVREELNIPIATLLDTKGPEIRTGAVKDDKKVKLVEGQKYTLTTREVPADDKINMVTYAGLPEDVREGNTILIDDGLIELRVDRVYDGTEIECTVINGGELGSKKGVNVPNVSIRLPGITQKDKEDIIFGVEQGFDFIAASFVRNAACIDEIKQLLWEHGADIPVIAKIENAEGIANIDEIIRVADGIMVARGDMGVEIPAEDVPHVQKEIIKKCNAQYKPVITATQMLDSMIRNPRPTRAEVTDVANAIYDGTDVVMLSGETANGKYPLEAVKMMVKIAERTEEEIKGHSVQYSNLHSKRSISSAVCNAAVQTADNLKARAIICPTISGFTARLTSKLKPEAEIIGCSPYDNVLRKMQIYWGVRPVKTAPEVSTDKIIEHAIVVSEHAGFVEEGDTVIVSAGIATTSDPSSKRGLTNTMRVVTI